jgi:hypothetical protein
MASHQIKEVKMIFIYISIAVGIILQARASLLPSEEFSIVLPKNKRDITRFFFYLLGLMAGYVLGSIIGEQSILKKLGF